MPKTTELMPSFNSVSAGSTATLPLPLGWAYHKLLIGYAGVTLAQMREIRVMGDGKVIRRFAARSGKSGAQFLDQINQYDKMSAANGILQLDLRRKVRTKQGEEVTVIGTGMTRSEKQRLQSVIGSEAMPDGIVNMPELTSLTLEIDIDAGATAPALTCRAIRAGKWPMGMLLKVHEYQYSPSAAGEFEISDIPKGDIFNRVFFKSDKITRLQVLRNNNIEFDRTKEENDLIQTDGKYRTPNPEWFVYDPTEEGDGSEGLVTAGVSDLRFRLFMSEGADVPVTVERLGYMER